MSDTPLTDAMVTGNSNPGPDEYEDLAKFTRQLERENAAHKATQTIQAKAILKLHERIEKLERLLSEADQDSARLYYLLVT